MTQTHNAWACWNETLLYVDRARNKLRAPDKNDGAVYVGSGIFRHLLNGCKLSSYTALATYLYVAELDGENEERHHADDGEALDDEEGCSERPVVREEARSPIHTLLAPLPARQADQLVVLVLLPQNLGVVLLLEEGAVVVFDLGFGVGEVEAFLADAAVGTASEPHVLDELALHGWGYGVR